MTREVVGQLRRISGQQSNIIRARSRLSVFRQVRCQLILITLQIGVARTPVSGLNQLSIRCCCVVVIDCKHEDPVATAACICLTHGSPTLQVASRQAEAIAELLLPRRLPAAYRHCLAECLRR